MNKLFTYLLFLLLVFPIITNAQPSKKRIASYHMQSQIPMRPLTAAEKEQMEMSEERSDSIDLLNYIIDLEVIDFASRHINGICTIEFELIEPSTAEMVLDLLQLSIDSIQINGTTVSYEYDGDLITIPFTEPLDPEATHTVSISYNGTPTVAASGFGGMAFEGGVAYNLGIGLGENPYNYGRSWFPCFDNFVERATFDLNIETADGRRAYCSGHFVEEVELPDGHIRRSYRIDLPLTTYLVGVAVSDYTVLESSHTGQYGTYPIELIAHSGDMGDVDESFQYLPEAIDCAEHWFGPYVWGRVGFVMTPVGAMEHSNNIAYPLSVALSGPTENMNGLMSHELMHHWWGNVTTLSSPANMWIKEGNAEYGSHLFTEYTFGREAFIQQVKANHQDVLATAHLDDDGFHPLSGIPYEHTYGTHTYNKGASMLHNMRTYMGDSLFSFAQTAVLQDFAFDAINAEQYRDHLSLISGIDMGPFFDAWIFGTGYSNFEIETMDVIPQGDGFEVDLTVQQKLRAADNLHNEVPIFVTFFSDDWEEYTTKMTASGEFSSASLEIPFEPAMTVLNHNQELNIGRTNRLYRINEEGALNIGGTGLFSLTAQELPDSALFNIVHHWTAADPYSAPGEIEVSNTHFWTVRGIAPEGFSVDAVVRFNGGESQLDHELVQNGIETVRMLYRPDSESEWQVYPNATITPLGNGGLVRLEPFIPGDYTLANVYINVNTEDVSVVGAIKLSPNPADQLVQLEVIANDNDLSENYQITLFDSQGQLLKELNYPATQHLTVDLTTTDLPNGAYIIDVYNGVTHKAVEMFVQH